MNNFALWCNSLNTLWRFWEDWNVLGNAGCIHQLSISCTYHQNSIHQISKLLPSWKYILKHEMCSMKISLISRTMSLYGIHSVSPHREEAFVLFRWTSQPIFPASSSWIRAEFWAHVFTNSVQLYVHRGSTTGLKWFVIFMTRFSDRFGMSYWSSTTYYPLSKAKKIYYKRY